MNVSSSIANQQAALAQEVSYAVAAKTLDIARTQGDAVASLLESAVQMQAEVSSSNAAKRGGSGLGRFIDVTG